MPLTTRARAAIVGACAAVLLLVVVLLATVWKGPGAESLPDVEPRIHDDVQPEVEVRVAFAEVPPRGSR